MLRNRKNEEALKLKGVNRVDEETDLELGEFEELANFVPEEVYSFHKKRGVTALNDCGLANLATEADDPMLTEAGIFLLTEFSTPCHAEILLENVNQLVTEAGDPIVTET